MTTTMTTTEPARLSLYDLGSEALALQAEISALAEQLGSEDDAGAIEQLEALLLAEEGNRQALEAKADAYCWVIAQQRAQAAYRRAEADRLRELADADAARADALEDRLLGVLTRLAPKETSFNLPAHEIRSRRSERVVILDQDELPEALLSVREERQPDKAAIKAAIKAGREVPGAELVQARSWSIR